MPSNHTLWTSKLPFRVRSFLHRALGTLWNLKPTPEQDGLAKAGTAAALKETPPPGEGRREGIDLGVLLETGIRNQSGS